MREVEAAGDDERVRIAVAVADWKAEYGQVQQLARLARDNADEDSFHTQLHTDGRWDNLVQRRYGHLKSLVSDGRESTPTEEEARPGLVELGCLVDLGGGQSWVLGLDTVAGEDLAHSAPVDPEAVAQLVHRRADASPQR